MAASKPIKKASKAAGSSASAVEKKGKSQDKKAATNGKLEKSALSPTFVTAVNTFLTQYGFDKTSKAFSSEHSIKKPTKGTTNGADTANSPSLVEIFESWELSQSKPSATSTFKKDDKKIAATESSDDDSDSSDSGLSSSDSSDSDVEMKDTASSTSESDSDSDSSSDSNSDSDSDVAPSKPAIVPQNGALKRKLEDSSSSSSDDSDSDSSSDESHAAKRTKLSANAKKPATNTKGAKSPSRSSSDDSSSSSSDSDSDSDSSASSKSAAPTKKPASKKNDIAAIAAKVPLPESDSSDSSDSSSSAGENITARNGNSSADSSTTLRESSSSDTSSSSQSTTDKKEATTPKKHTGAKPTPLAVASQQSHNHPSNAYVPYAYAERAHKDLSVTRGKGFTKEKNKKKRGSYRGGPIDIGPGKSFKFED